MNIPIFRAKKKDSDEYVEGCFNIWEQNGKVYYSIMDVFEFPSPYSNIHIINPTTLAIHFENMIDIKGDKIFASLQDDGKGGDILFDMEYEFTLIFDGLKFRLEGLECNTEISEYDKFTDFDNIGIQQ